MDSLLTLTCVQGPQEIALGRFHRRICLTLKYELELDPGVWNMNLTTLAVPLSLGDEDLLLILWLLSHLATGICVPTTWGLEVICFSPFTHSLVL